MAASFCLLMPTDTEGLESLLKNVYKKGRQTSAKSMD